MTVTNLFSCNHAVNAALSLADVELGVQQAAELTCLACPNQVCQASSGQQTQLEQVENVLSCTILSNSSMTGVTGTLQRGQLL